MIMMTLDRFFKINIIKRNLDKEIFQEYEVPSNWKILRFKDILDEVDIRVYQVSSSGNIEVYSLTKDRGLIPQTKRFKKRVATEDISKYKVVKKGWLVYNPFVIWEGAITVLLDKNIVAVSPVYLTWRPRNNVMPRFLYYLAKTRYLLSQFQRYASGAVNRRRSIKKSDFLNIEIPIPPLEEQAKIVYVLDTIRQAIDVQDRLLYTFNELKRALMNRLFTKGLDPNQSTKQTEIGEIPAHWKVLSLGDILVKIQYGLSMKGHKDNSGYPLLRMNNIVDGRIILNDLQYVKIDYKTLIKFKLEKGDLLFNRTNSPDLVGKTAIFDIDGTYVFASYLIRLRVNSRMANPYFINYYLNWDKTQIRIKKLASRGVSQANVSATKLKTLKIALPPLDEQEQIANILRTIDEKISIIEKKRSILQELFDVMLHKLMTGQIRVSNLDEIYSSKRPSGM